MIDYRLVLADLETRRDLLDEAIAALKDLERLDRPSTGIDTERDGASRLAALYQYQTHDTDE